MCPSDQQQQQHMEERVRTLQAATTREKNSEWILNLILAIFIDFIFPK
jgi:hypothetical protein